MSTNNPQPNQDIKIAASNVLNSTITQASGDVYQIEGDLHQINIFFSSLFDINKNKIFIENNFNKISFLKRPLQFFKVLIFLIKVLIFWLFIWWKVDYQLPIDLAWDLIKSSWRGELTQSINGLQLDSNLKLNQFIHNPNGFSLEEKIALEAQIKLCFDLIQNLASSESSDRQEKISDFLFENRFKLSWFSDQIKRDKIKNYKKLYNLQSKASKRNKSKEIVETYVGYIIFLLSTCSPSPDIIGELIQKTDAFIDLNKKQLSANNLATLKSLKKILRLITQKFILDPFDDGSLQEKYYSLLEQKREEEQKHQLLSQEKDNLKEENSLLEDKNISLLAKINEIQKMHDKLKDDSQLQAIENSQLTQRIRNMDTERVNFLVSQRTLKEELEQLRADTDKMQEDPVGYLIDHSQIEEYIAKKDCSVYHYHRACRHWQSFVFSYLLEKKYNIGEPSEFIVSASRKSFKGMSECSLCQKKLTKQ